MNLESINKKKILVLIPHFLPGFKLGGPLTSVINLIENLSCDFTFEVLTSDRDMGDNKPYDNIKFNSWIKKPNFNVLYISPGFFSIYRLILHVNNSKADVVYLNSLFSPIFSISIVLASKIGLLKSKTIILAPRGESFSEALDFKKLKKKWFLFFAKNVSLYKHVFWHASTEIEKKSIVKNLDIESHMVHVALNLAQKRVFDEKKIINIISKNSYNLYVVFLSRISKDKNLEFALDILKKINSNVVFHIYGPIEDSYIWEICKGKISDLPDNVIVEYKGSVAKDDVKVVLSNYDLMFLPTFAENFGHVIVESLSVGTPVLLSDNTPWRDLENKEFGWDFSLKEPELFINAIYRMSNFSIEEKNDMRFRIRNNFSVFLNNSESLSANKKMFGSL